MNAESSPEYKTTNRESEKDLEQSDEQPKSYLNDIELNIISNMRFPQELPRSRYLELRNQYSVNHRDYPLNYNQRTGRDEIGNCYDIDSLLTKYVSSTRDLIYQMDGRLKQTYTNGSGESIDENAPDDVIYLDKSARPVEWMVRKFWSVMAQDGTVQPKSHFVNIDRVDWLLSQPDNAGKLISDLNHNDFKKEQVSAEDIARIRSIFVEGKLTPENWQQEVWQMPTVLDGRKVLIVDEVSSTGATIKIAKDLIQLACPETFVNTSVFWYPEYKVLTIWNERDQKYDNEW